MNNFMPTFESEMHWTNSLHITKANNTGSLNSPMSIKEIQPVIKKRKKTFP